jgi:sulfotransferase
MKKMFFLSGMPRSGSTLLSSILSQNPEIHSEGNSALCQIMWDLHISINNNSLEQILATKRLESSQKIIKSIPQLYYKNIEKDFVIDKCRSWTIPANIDLIERYIDQDPKIVVMIRDVVDVISSFVNLYQKNNVNVDIEDLLILENSEPLCRSIDGILNSFKDNKNIYHYVNYDDLVFDTKNTLNNVYDFLKIKNFDHDLNKIINLHPEDDSVYGLNGMHEVREKIEKISTDIKLKDSTIQFARNKNKILLDYLGTLNNDNKFL